jgi:N-acetylhexosamine kinase
MMSAKQGGHSVNAEAIVWRVFPFAEGYTSYEFIEAPWQAEKAATAFATFMKTFANIDTSRLQATIPNFHNGHLRFQQLEDAYAQATLDRKKKAQKLYEFAQQHKVIFDLIQKIGRAVQQECRDFGDMVRTSVSPTEENEPDDTKIVFNTEFFEALCKGFSVMNSVMTASEKAHIVDGAKYMIFIIGIRFLADYFNNDIYFKISYPEENYIRARNQFVLFQRLEDKENELKTIAAKYFN